MSNKEEKEVIYSNDVYRVEKVGIDTDGVIIYMYGVYHDTYDVLEIETPILAKALSGADELEKAVTTFFQDKAFEGVGQVVTA